MITFRALRALRWLADHPQAAELPTDVSPAADADVVYEELRVLGLVDDTRTLGGTYEFILTPDGRVQARNAVDLYRSEFAQRCVLEWIASHTNLDGLIGSRSAIDFTGSLTVREAHHAADELVESGMLSGSRTANGEFYYLEITATGRATLRSPYPVGSSSGGAAPGVFNISADNYGTMTVGNQVIGGERHTVTANLTMGSSLDSVLEAIKQLRDTVAVADGDALDREEALADIDDLLEKGPRRGLAWIKAALVAVGTQLATSFGQGLADQALQIGSGIL